MAGIYLHIPFCKQACHYCNFHFSTSMKSKNDFVAALLKETGLKREYLQQEVVETIYFGGGTPSLLTHDDLNRILEKLRHEFDISSTAEITFEANPDDISRAKVNEWKQAGINRLSIGVQSFFEEDLQWMNRAHNARQALSSIKMARDGGLDNISIDFIYGAPGLTDERWEKNISQAIDLHIPHLSCYALTVERNTALSKMIHLKKKEDIDPDDQSRQFLLLMARMATAGYEHYEISNFALPGKRSRHNSAYWQGKKYLGLGPSAHSYNIVSRQWNISNNIAYIQSLEKNELLFEKEILTSTQSLNEFIMVSLRTNEGIDLNYVAEKFGLPASNKLEKNIEPYIKNSKVKKVNAKILLTDEGKLFADGIAAALFFVEKKKNP